MTNKQILDTTVDSATYNKARKIFLEKEGEIRCSRCGYHRGENDTRKYYGSRHTYRAKALDPMRHPNWKLVSKNRKQWMKKPISYKEHYMVRDYWDRSFHWIEIKF